MKKTVYRLESDIPDDEPLVDGNGRLVDDLYVVQAVSDALREARRRGRPSLSPVGESPVLRVRLPPDLNEAVSRAADRQGTSRADWVRAVLASAVRKET